MGKRAGGRVPIVNSESPPPTSANLSSFLRPLNIYKHQRVHVSEQSFLVMGPGPRNGLQIFPYKLMHYNVPPAANTVCLRCILGLLYRAYHLNFYKGSEQILS